MIGLFLVLSLGMPIFSDGFESGDTSRWSKTVSQAPTVYESRFEMSRCPTGSIRMRLIFDGPIPPGVTSVQYRKTAEGGLPPFVVLGSGAPNTWVTVSQTTACPGGICRIQPWPQFWPIIATFKATIPPGATCG